MIKANRSDHTAARGAMSREVKGGLEDVVVSPSAICFIDGQKGRLLYRGFDIDDLVEHSSFEEVVYLLWHGALPSRKELDAHVKVLSATATRKLPPGLLVLLRALPKKTTPMEVLRTGVSALSAFDPDAAANSREVSARQTVRAEGWIRKALGDKARVMGFGHRVYRVEDPRAKHLRRLALELGQQAGDTRSVEILNTVARVVTQEKHIYPNVDLYSGAAYKSMGIPTDQFTPIFALSRVAGWAAHVMEQHANNRLIRPRAEYTGPTHVTYVPIDRR